MKYTLYADGSSTGKVGEGGWGFVLLEDDRVIYEANGGEDATTNNRMELLGVIEGLRYIIANYTADIELEVFSDSQYVIKGLNEWYPAWAEKMARGKAIKNQDLWKDIKSLVDLFENIELKWVRGHAGHEHNERCDQLAKAAKLDVKIKSGRG